MKTLSRGFVVKLDAQTDAEVYFRVTSYRNFYLPLTLWSEPAFRAQEVRSNLFTGLFYGTILIMIIYNMFLFANVRDKNYLYYLFYAVANLLLFASTNEHFAYLNLTHNYFYTHHSSVVFCLLVISRIYFCRNFLQVERFNRALDKLFTVLLGFAWVNLFLGILPDDFGLFPRLSPVLLVCAFALTFYTMLQGLLVGKAVARPYFLVTLVGETGLFIAFGTLLGGFIPHTELTDNALPLGLMLEVVLMSFVLSQRVKLLQQEKAELERWRDAGRQLRITPERIGQVFGRTDLALIAFDEAGIIRLATPRVMELTGWRQEQLLEERLTRLIPESANAQHLLHRVLECEELPAPEEIHPTELATANGTSRFRLRVDQLELEETVNLLFMSPEGVDLQTGAALALPPHQQIHDLNQINRQISVLSEKLRTLNVQNLGPDGQLVAQLEALGGKLSVALDYAPESQQGDDRFRHKLVELMNAAVQCWEASTGRSRVELAEKSRIWGIHVDEGRLRTRTLDRYLNLETLPARPRWRQVVRTAYFVLGHSGTQAPQVAEQREHLKIILEAFQQIAR